MTSNKKCRRCNRSLKNPLSIRLEIGPACLAKELKTRQKESKNIQYPKLLREEAPKWH